MLKVLTLNCWCDLGPWDERRALIRQWVDRLDPDVIGFQEILGWEDGRNTAQQILEGAGYQIDYQPGGRFWQDRAPWFGNAIASKWPMADREAIKLPDRGDQETRCALNVTIDAPFGPLSMTSTHLNWKFHHGYVRERQVQAVADLVLRRRPKDGFPPVLVGDLNAEPESAEIRFLTGLQSIDGKSTYLGDAWRVAGDTAANGATWSNRNVFARVAMEPERRIDYVLVGYPTVQGLGMIENARVVCDEPVDGVFPSDHFGVYAELRTDPLQF